MTPIQEQLFALRDESYADFMAKLLPTVAPERIVGVRAPQMQRMAKALIGTPQSTEFLSRLPHQYIEENGLHAVLISTEKDYDVALAEVEHFLPHIDNWATCDSLIPQAFVHHEPQLLPHVRQWMASEAEYTVRFGIGMLMRHYLAPATFNPCQLQWVAAINREEYYIRMMQAWYMATALAKQWDSALPWMQRGRMGEWVRRKSIQKAVESYRVSDEHKALLRSLR